jgi:hypothetical protein
MIRGMVLVALLANGLGAGVMLSTAIGMVPMTLALPYDRYVEMIQFMWPRYDPFMPIANGLAFSLDVGLAVFAGSATARACFGIGSVLLSAVMIISVVKNVPINKYVTALDPACRPANWATADPRQRWRSWNLLRTALAVAALVATTAGAVA